VNPWVLDPSGTEPCKGSTTAGADFVESAGIPYAHLKNGDWLRVPARRDKILEDINCREVPVPLVCRFYQ